MITVHILYYMNSEYITQKHSICILGTWLYIWMIIVIVKYKWQSRYEYKNVTSLSCKQE